VRDTLTPSWVTELPRSQTGANPQRVMAALLGDYWLDRDEHLPSTTLVDLVAEFGVTAASGRAALSRLLRRGTLEVRKVGRTTRYRLSDNARAGLRRTGDELVAAVHGGARAWDGRWTVVAFSVREDRREVRHALRSGLRRLGFAPLYDGVWAAPYDDGPLVDELLSGLGVEQATVLRSDVLHPAGDTPGHPAGIWDLAALRRDWTAFAGEQEVLLDALDAGRLAPQEALRDRLALLDRWAALVETEPALPVELLPPDWPRRRATELFVAAADALAPLAETRFREIVGRAAPELAHLATARRTTR
jgi:phenylacetic acid degradation operon negative regulatory protein